MAHTPGPWKIRDVIVIGGGFDIGIVAEENGLVSLIAEVYEVVNLSERKADVKANARLIAAVPDLMEALKDWRDMFEWGDFSIDFSNGITYQGIDEGVVKGNAMLKEMLEETKRALAQAGER